MQKRPQRTIAAFYTISRRYALSLFSPDPLSRLRSRLAAPAGLHRTVQYAFFAFFLYVGLRFYFYAMWAMGQSDIYVPKPPSAEAFLPISALLGAKRLLFTGLYDPVHPAGLTIFLLACATAFLLRKGFCGYLCPVGCLSMLLDRLGARLGIRRRPGKFLSALLSLPKYGLLAFFAWIVLWNMSLADIEGFIRTPYNQVADTKMLLFFLHPTTTLLVILGVLVLGGMLIPSFWCRGFCPYGALLGLFSWLSPVALRRDPEACTNCRRCTSACPSRIPVHEKLRISGPECVGCTECAGACPQKDCLTVRLGYTEKAVKLPAWSIAAGTLLALYLFFAWATATGNWETRVPPAAARALHQNILRLDHP